MEISKHQLELIRFRLEELNTCLVEAPVDFLGTGDNGRAATKEEKEWNLTWRTAYMDIDKILKSIK